MGGLENTGLESPATDPTEGGHHAEMPDGMPEVSDVPNAPDPAADLYVDQPPEPVNDGLELSPPDTGPPPVLDDVVDPEMLLAMNSEIAKVTKKGFAWELVILVLGGLFLLAALAFLAFLLWPEP